MMTGRVASRATSNDFYDLDRVGDDEIRDIPRPQPQPKSWTSQTGLPKGGSTVFSGVILLLMDYS